VIQFDDLGDLLEALLELLDLPKQHEQNDTQTMSVTTNLLEMITQLDNRRSLKHSVLVDDKLPVLERVDVALDQEKI
jgi:hypothetical protein